MKSSTEQQRIEAIREPLPDQTPEAIRIIKDLLKPSEEYGFRFALGARERAEQWLKQFEQKTK